MKNTLAKKIRPFITEKDENAKPLDEADADLRDSEIVPFLYDGGIDGYMKAEVLPYAADAYVDEKKTSIGYELSFTKYFYKPVELRSIDDILVELQTIEAETDGMMADIVGGLQK